MKTLLLTLLILLSVATHSSDNKDDSLVSYLDRQIEAHGRDAKLYSQGVVALVETAGILGIGIVSVKSAQKASLARYTSRFHEDFLRWKVQVATHAKAGQMVEFRMACLSQEQFTLEDHSLKCRGKTIASVHNDLTRKLRTELTPIYKKFGIPAESMELQLNQFKRALQANLTDVTKVETQLVPLVVKAEVDWNRLVHTKLDKSKHRGYNARKLREYKKHLKIKRTWKPTRLRKVFSKLRLLGIGVLTVDVLNRIYNMTLGDLDDLTLLERLLPVEGGFPQLLGMRAEEEDEESDTSSAELTSQFDDDSEPEEM